MCVCVCISNVLQVVAKRKWSRKSLEVAFDKFVNDPEVLALQQELQQLMQG